MSLYTEIVAAGIPVDNHYSDLYVKATPESFALLKKHKQRFSGFKHTTLREMWYDVPFMYEPYWEARACRV